MANMVNITIYRPSENDTVNSLSDVGEWVKTEYGQVVPPTYRLRAEAFEALSVAMGSYTQSSDATVDALKDSRMVRDRLLKLVEDGWTQ